MTSPIKNDQGQLSGAKLVLMLACLLAAAWLVRDLFFGQELSEQHTALLSILLVIGLVNRISARGRIKVRLKDMEVESGCHHLEGEV